VNRQRCLFQAGRLKKDRQEDLEKLGLRWSVLTTTPWEDMYKSLCVYAQQQQTLCPGGWDGNIEANYKTNTHPQLSLGRWVNRQRSAYAKRHLKDEYVQQLNAIGLQWAIPNSHTDIISEGNDDDVDHGNVRHALIGIANATPDDPISNSSVLYESMTSGGI
jgi:hypothetical protein